MLAKKYRLHLKKEIEEVFEKGKYKHLFPFLTLHYLKKENLDNSKVSFIISKKTEKTAVGRNRGVRQARHIILNLIQNNKLIGNYHLIFVIRKGFLGLENKEQIKKVLELLSELK